MDDGLDLGQEAVDQGQVACLCEWTKLWDKDVQSNIVGN